MRLRSLIVAGGSAVALGLTAVVGGQALADGGDRGNGGGSGGRMVDATMPITPSVGNYEGELNGNTRTFKLTALPVTQQIATFPVQNAIVWGWKVTGQDDATASTPGPTLVASEGEQIVFEITNQLQQPTSLHPHGTHEPNSADGVAGIDFAPIEPGATFTYPAYTPDHPGTFAYHTHTSTAVQEPRGVVGMITILPKKIEADKNPQVDVAMTLQQFNPDGADVDGSELPGEGGKELDPASDEGGLVAPMPDDRGMFPFSTINGKTGDASNTGAEPNGEIAVKEGDLVQVRLYNASGMSHAMHLHGMDMTLVDINGHPVTPQTVTTKAIAPGEFFTLQFRAISPGNWLFHCSFPGHQANGSQSGYQGAPVGMTRIFRVGDVDPVPPAYFGPPAS